MNGARPQVRMYTTAFCPYCQRAERLLAARGVAEIEKIRVDLEPAQRVEMMQKTGRRTVPQIYIGEQHVGGFDDIAELDREGRLEPMLRGADTASPDTASSTLTPKASS
jgi:glutaredoxin 3